MNWTIFLDFWACVVVTILIIVFAGWWIAWITDIDTHHGGYETIHFKARRVWFSVFGAMLVLSVWLGLTQ